VQALRQLENAENQLTSAEKEPRGLLRLAEIGHSLLAELVPAFLGKYPKMEVDVTVTNRVLDLIAEGIDLAIRAGDLADSRLIAKRFSLGHFGLWAGSDYLKSAACRSIRKH